MTQPQANPEPAGREPSPLPRRKSSRAPTPVDVRLPGVGPRLVGIGLFVVVLSALVLFTGSSPARTKAPQRPLPALTPTSQR